MILARLKWNTKLVEVDEFVTKFSKKYKNDNLRVDVKLTDTECLVYFYKDFINKHQLYSIATPQASLILFSIS